MNGIKCGVGGGELRKSLGMAKDSQLATQRWSKWLRTGELELEERLAKGGSLKRPTKDVVAEPMVPPLVGLCPLSKDSHKVAPTS